MDLSNDPSNVANEPPNWPILQVPEVQKSVDDGLNWAAELNTRGRRLPLESSLGDQVQFFPDEEAIGNWLDNGSEATKFVQGLAETDQNEG